MTSGVRLELARPAPNRPSSPFVRIARANSDSHDRSNHDDHDRTQFQTLCHIHRTTNHPAMTSPPRFTSQMQPVRASHQLLQMAAPGAAAVPLSARHDDSSPRSPGCEANAGLTSSTSSPRHDRDEQPWRCAAVARLSRRPLDISDALNVALYGSATSPTHKPTKVGQRHQHSTCSAGPEQEGTRGCSMKAETLTSIHSPRGCSASALRPLSSAFL